MQTRNSRKNLVPGFCALMRPGGIYDAEHDENDPLGITFVHFDMLISKRSKQTVGTEIYQKLPEFFRLQNLAFFDVVCRKITEYSSRAPAIGAVLLKGVLMDLISNPQISDSRFLDKPISIHTERIQQVAEDIRCWDHFGPRSVAEMASKLHLSPPHFSRIFKRVIGQTPMHFLLQTRLSHARHLLRETNLSIGEIAERLGYNDLFFFSRQFMEKEGTSPSQYRARQISRME